MGDAILSGPGLRRFRQSLPESRITFLAGRSVCEVLEGAPWADQWLCADGMKSGSLRRERFDAAIVLANSFRSALLVRAAGIKHVVGYDRDGRGFLLSRAVRPFRAAGQYVPMSMLHYYAFLIDQAIEYFGGSPGAEQDNRLELFTSQDDRRPVDEMFSQWQIAPGERVVVMVPGGAFGPSKWWPPERFGAVAQRLHHEHGARVIISCAPTDAEQQLAEAVCLTSAEELRRLPTGFGLGPLKELVRRSALMISNDTGPCHIAAAFETPLVTMFGPTDPRWTATGYAGEIRLQGDLDCGPCQRPICQHQHRCMESISVDKVYHAAVSLLDEHSKPPNNQTVRGSYYNAYQEGFVPLRDGTGVVHADYKALLERSDLGCLAEVFGYQQGQSLIKPGLGGRERIRLVLRDDDNKEAAVYLKRYGREPVWQFFKRCLTRRRIAPPAAYDFAGNVKLPEIGITVPRPIAMGAGKGWARSFVMSEELPNAEALERLLPRGAQACGEYELLRNKPKLIMELAELVRRLHQGGYYHRDLYLSHIFLCKDKQGVERLALIDLQRVFQPKVWAERWRIKDLAQLYYSARRYFTGNDQLRFLRLYLGQKSLDAGAKRLAARVVAKAVRIARHDAKRCARMGDCGP